LSVCRSSEEQFEASANQRQLADAEPNKRSEDALSTVLPTRVDTTPQAVGPDLAQQLQRTVRDEMRRIMEVRYYVISYNLILFTFNHLY